MSRLVLVFAVAVCAVLYGASAAPLHDSSPCRSPVAPYQIVDCGVILELAEILSEAHVQELARAHAEEFGSPTATEQQLEAHMQQRARAHAEQIGGGSSSTTTSTTTTKCYMSTYPFSEISCGQLELQSDKQLVKEYAELMKRLGKY